MLNLQRIFYSSKHSDSYHDLLLPTDAQKQRLTNAKNDIRDHLRAGIERASMSALGFDRRVTPRFRTQGSWSYNTCNQPAHMPPQEMDWDLGVYLPISAWDENRPRVAAVAYYQLLETLLEELCEEQGWALCPKETCVRVQIGGCCHIDVPPYAVPDSQFTAIQERVLAKSSMSLDRSIPYWDASYWEMLEPDWDQLDEVVLATRSGEWKPSDPGVVSEWFRYQIEEHGEQLRRVCRYLKGWRDFQWKEGGPSSVCLMVCVCQLFQPMHRRDDLALLEVALGLGAKLEGDIFEELIDEREDFNNLDGHGRKFAAARARDFSQILKDGLEAGQWEKAQVLKGLRSHLGGRLPNQPDWIAVDSPSAVVKAAPAVVVPQPEVRRTKSG